MCSVYEAVCGVRSLFCEAASSCSSKLMSNVVLSALCPAHRAHVQAASGPLLWLRMADCPKTGWVSHRLAAVLWLYGMCKSDARQARGRCGMLSNMNADEHDLLQDIQRVCSTELHRCMIDHILFCCCSGPSRIQVKCVAGLTDKPTLITWDGKLRRLYATCRA